MIRYYNNILLSFTEIKNHPVLLIHGLTGCSFHCFKCFNFDELIAKSPKKFYTIYDVLETIKKEEKLYDYIIFSGGEFLRAKLDDLRSDLTKVRKVSNKPIIIYTNGTELHKMEELFEEGLVDGFHMDMKLPYHLLTMEDKDLIELTIGVKVFDLSLFETLTKSLEFVVKRDIGYNQIRSVKYPFIGESAFNVSKEYIDELNKRFNKNVPYYVNDFIYPEEAE